MKLPGAKVLAGAGVAGLRKQRERDRNEKDMVEAGGGQQGR